MTNPDEVEFKGAGGAKIGYDGPHASPGKHMMFSIFLGRPLASDLAGEPNEVMSLILVKDIRLDRTGKSKASNYD